MIRGQKSSILIIKVTLRPVLHPHITGHVKSSRNHARIDLPIDHGMPLQPSGKPTGALVTPEGYRGSLSRNAPVSWRLRIGHPSPWFQTQKLTKPDGLSSVKGHWTLPPGTTGTILCALRRERERRRCRPVLALCIECALYNCASCKHYQWLSVIGR